jgi:uncharacterized protein (TIGR00730 family)
MNRNKPAICVFCGSAEGSNPAFSAAAARLGRLIAETEWRLLFGGGGHGLMGVLAKAARQAGGEVVGIMPDFLRAYELPPEWERELILTSDMQQRKAQLLDAADAFVVLPGGPGTMDEFFEVLVAASLGVLRPAGEPPRPAASAALGEAPDASHFRTTSTKPILVVNIGGFFDPLDTLMAHMDRHGFVRSGVCDLYRTVATPDEALAIIGQALNLQYGS